MNIVLIDFSVPYLGTIAKQGEHGKTQLAFTLPEDFAGADYVNAEFTKQDETTAVIEQLTPVNGAVTVPLTQELTDVDGRLEIQLVAYAADGTEITEIAKSPIVRGVIKRSLNVLHGQDKPGVIERFLAFVNNWAPKLTELWAAKHTHTNKPTLDEFRCRYLDEGRPEIEIGPGGMANPLNDRLSWQNRYIRMVSDGGVIQNARQVTVNNREYLRLQIYYDPVMEQHDETVIGIEDDETATLPRFIDIPITSSEPAEITDGGLTLNGIEIDLGFDSLDEASHTHANRSTLDEITAQTLTDVAANTVSRHSHLNKPTLDSLSWTSLGSTVALTFDNKIVGFYPVKSHVADFYGAVYSNVENRFGTEQNPATAITVTSLSNSVPAQTNEFILDFYSGATPTTLTLPASVEWADELTVEANKHYQISILNNIALWCAVDVEVEE